MIGRFSIKSYQEGNDHLSVIAGCSNDRYFRQGDCHANQKTRNSAERTKDKFSTTILKAIPLRTYRRDGRNIKQIYKLSDKTR